MKGMKRKVEEEGRKIKYEDSWRNKKLMKEVERRKKEKIERDCGTVGMNKEKG